MSGHVAMHLDLEIDAHRAHGADDNIRADPTINRHVPTRIRQSQVGRIVGCGDPYLADRRLEQSIDIRIRPRRCANERHKKQGEKKANAHNQVFWTTIFGNWIDLLRACRAKRAAALRAISR